MGIQIKMGGWEEGEGRDEHLYLHCFRYDNRLILIEVYCDKFVSNATLQTQ